MVNKKRMEHNTQMYELARTLAIDTFNASKGDSSHVESQDPASGADGETRKAVEFLLNPENAFKFSIFSAKFKRQALGAYLEKVRFMVSGFAFKEYTADSLKPIHLQNLGNHGATDASAECSAAAGRKAAAESSAAAERMAAAERKAAADMIPAEESKAAAESRAEAERNASIESRAASERIATVEVSAAAASNYVAESKAAADSIAAAEGGVAGEINAAAESNAAAECASTTESNAAAKSDSATDSHIGLAILHIGNNADVVKINQEKPEVISSNQTRKSKKRLCYFRCWPFRSTKL